MAEVSCYPKQVSSMESSSIGSTIECQVLQVLPDLILVSFAAPDKRVFQGALLDTTNR